MFCLKFQSSCKLNKFSWFGTEYVEKSRKTSLTMKSWPFWPLVLWEILWYSLVSKSEKSWREFLVLSQNPRNIARFLYVLCWARFMDQRWLRNQLCKPSDQSQYDIYRQLTRLYNYRPVMVQAPALTVSWAITDPFISNWLDHLLHLSERFCEEVCDCQVCWYVNRADNRWHWVQEAVLVFSHILLSKIYQSIW